MRRVFGIFTVLTWLNESLKVVEVAGKVAVGDGGGVLTAVVCWRRWCVGDGSVMNAWRQHQTVAKSSAQNLRIRLRSQGHRME